LLTREPFDAGLPVPSPGRAGADPPRPGRGPAT